MARKPGNRVRIMKIIANDNRTHFIYNFREKHREAIFNFFQAHISQGERSIEKLLSMALSPSPVDFWKPLAREIIKDGIAAYHFIQFLIEWCEADNDRKIAMKNSSVKFRK